MKKLTSIIVVLLAILPLSSYGQDVYALQWDKPYYAAGETVQYNISVPTAFSNAGGVVKISVLPNESPSLEHISFIRTESSAAVAKGYYDIKIGAPSGRYHLIVSALDKLDMKEKIIGKGFFTVINPFTDSEITQIESLSSKGGENKLNVKFSEVTSSNPQSISAQFLNGSDESLDGSVSYFVTNLEQIFGGGNHSDIATYNIISDVTIGEPMAQLFYSNYAGERSNLGNRVMGAYMTKTDEFVYANAKSENFVLTIDDFVGEQNIQLLDQRLNTFTVNRRSENVTDMVKSVDAAVVKKYVQDYIDRRRVEQYFGSHKKRVAIEDYKIKKVEPKKASQSFNLREYENFLTLSKFFEEVSTPLKMEKVEGKYIAQLANPQYRGQSRLYFKGTPLFIIDGIVTNDVNIVANLDFNSVNTVELFSNPSILRDYYSMMGKSGVVKITTSRPNFSIPTSSVGVVSINGIQEKRETTLNQSYIQNDRFPVFGSTLSSVSNIAIGPDGMVKLNLPKSNEVGSFLITAMFRSNTGMVHMASQSYDVNGDVK